MSKFKPFDLKKYGTDAFVSNKIEDIKKSVGVHMRGPSLVENLATEMMNSSQNEVLNRYHEKQLFACRQEMTACENQYETLWEELHARLEALVQEYGVETSVLTYRMKELQQRIDLHEIYLKKQKEASEKQGKNAS